MIPGKLAFFTAAGVGAYGVLMLVIGMEAVLGEYQAGGMWILALTVILWDLMFLLVDRVLGMTFRRRR